MATDNPYLKDFVKSYDYEDSALNDFIGRFGDDDPNKELVQTKNKSKYAVKTSQELEDKANKGLSMEGFEAFQKNNPITTGGLNTPYNGEVAKQTWGENINIPEGKSKPAVKPKGQSPDVADYAMAGAQGYEFVGNAFGGKQFDSSAEGGGPGKAGGQIALSASKGAQAGMAFGPWGAVIGAGVGAGSAIIGHSKAQKEYNENRKKYNLGNDAVANAKMEEEYARSEGLESMSNLKALRQRQLGILS